MIHMKKRLFALLLCIFYAAGLSAFAAEEKAPVLTIIHTTDVHSRVDGYAAVAALADKYRAESENVLVLDSGDTFHGLPFANLEKGKAVAEVMKEIGYDAMTAGNHDFNFGWQRLKELETLSGASVLAANVVTDEGGKVFENDYIVREFDGMKVGIFGLANDDTPSQTAPANVMGIRFEDEIETAEKVVAELDSKVDFIIALTHVGSLGVGNGTSLELAEAVPEINLILDGHTHNENNGEMAGNTMVVADGRYLESIGVVKVYADKTMEFERVPVTEKSETSEPVKELIASIDASHAALLSEIVGESETVLNAEVPIVRSRETNFGNLICDSYLAETGADAALENGGGIRKTIGIGSFTKGDIFSALPFGNTLITKELTGTELKEVLENAMLCADTLGGDFLQVGGITFDYDSSKPELERITNLQISGKPMEEEKTYTVAANSYIASSFLHLKDKPNKGEFSTCDEILLKYIKENGVTVPEETRINQVNLSKEWLISLDGYAVTSDRQPIVGNTVFLPLRAVLEQAGFTVTWDGAAQTVYAEKEGSTISVDTIKQEAQVNGGAIIEMPLQNLQDRNMADMDAVAAMLDKDAAVDEKTHSIVLYKA